MIQVNELRINNFVLYKGEYSRIRGISARNFVKLNDYADEYDEKDIEPIDLSKVIDELGFPRKKMCLKCPSNFSEIFKERVGEKIVDNVYEIGAFIIIPKLGRYLYSIIVEDGKLGTKIYSPILWHLHQLQNIYFALTRKELEINLKVK